MSLPWFLFMLFIACSAHKDTGPTDSSRGDDSGDPVPGDPREMVITQILLPSSSLGEATLVIGPDRTSVLMDMGSDGHDDDILDVLDALSPGREVDWVVATHYHGDHIGSFDNLFSSGDIEIRRGVVTRGGVDLDEDCVNKSDYEELCEWREDHPSKDYSLCRGPSSPCDLDESGGPWPADSCDGLLQGNLEAPAEGEPTRIDLGDGAMLVFTAADGFVATDGKGVIHSDRVHDYDDDMYENARSIAGYVEYGAFIYAFAGDMTSGNDGTPNMEDALSHLAAGPGAAADVVHLDHHGLDSGSGQDLVDWLLPDDGHDRNAIVGCNSLYVTSPSGDVVDRVAPRVEDLWVTEPGSLANEDGIRVADGHITIRVEPGGVAYAIETPSGDTGPWPSE